MVVRWVVVEDANTGRSAVVYAVAEAVNVVWAALRMLCTGEAHRSWDMVGSG